VRATVSGPIPGRDERVAELDRRRKFQKSIEKLFAILSCSTGANLRYTPGLVVKNRERAAVEAPPRGQRRRNTMLAPLPPSSELDALEVARGGLHDPAPGSPVESSERDFSATCGCSASVLAGDVAVAGQDIDHTGRKANLTHQLAILSELSGGQLGGLHHHAIARRRAGPIFQLVNMIGKFHGTESGRLRLAVRARRS